ncbi:hypothetical protein [Chryseobacterium phocaeense]|uniref:hypothetical protein n=1 Tax=Chryseobacterium phocaeense TaxID=1816690 RepID=UPI0009BADD99|nr:hypothetical protein [Chryseobacterium phocaeense]
MKKFYADAYTLCTLLGLSAQEVLWQKNTKFSTQDFPSHVTTTIDQQHLIQASSIQGGSSASSGTYLVTIKTYNNKTANAKLIKK